MISMTEKGSAVSEAKLPTTMEQNLQFNVHPANSGPLNVKPSKERASEVEHSKRVSYQDEVKAFKGPGGIEVLKKLHSVGKDPDTPRVRRNGKDGLSVCEG